MIVAALDLEGVLIPEVWVGLAARTGLDELRRTTRDEPDYDRLMRARLEILARNKLGLRDIERCIAELAPLPGAREFLDALRAEFQVIILSDTFYEFAKPFMAQLGWPTLFCHELEVRDNGRITGYRLRQADPKRAAINALRALNFHTIASGDSYNDISMLKAADAGILFRPPQNVAREFAQFPCVTEYDDLRAAFDRAAQEITSRARADT